jgi:hypothetical protein
LTFRSDAIVRRLVTDQLFGPQLLRRVGTFQNAPHGIFVTKVRHTLLL